MGAPYIYDISHLRVKILPLKQNGFESFHTQPAILDALVPFLKKWSQIKYDIPGGK
jgi:hypothetical protein